MKNEDVLHICCMLAIERVTLDIVKQYILKQWHEVRSYDLLFQNTPVKDLNVYDAAGRLKIVLVEVKEWVQMTLDTSHSTYISGIIAWPPQQNSIPLSHTYEYP